MATKRRKINGSVSIGSAPKKLAKSVECTRIVINGFANLPSTKDHYIESSNFKAHGYEWCLRFYSGGRYKSIDGFVSVFLRNIGSDNKKEPSAQVAFCCKNADDGRNRSTSIHQFTKDHNIRGWTNFLNRDNIFANHLEDDGSLIIEVEIQITEDSRRIWYPKALEKQPFLIGLYQNISSEDSHADAIFVVEETNFSAHKIVLFTHAKILYDLSADYTKNEPIPIPGVSKQAFEKVLEFIYTVKTPTLECQSAATKLLVAADKCGCVDLKLLVESVITDDLLAVENSLEMLVFGDAHSCPLLKEASMNLISDNLDSVIGSGDWPMIKESSSLLAELLQLTGRKHAPKINDSSSNIINNCVDEMDVSTLRENLQELDLELDGSRELLVRRLKEEGFI